MRRRRIAIVAGVVTLVAAIGAALALAAGGRESWTGGGAMGGRYAYRPAQPIQVQTLASARSEAQRFADRLGLRVDEVMQFQRNFYAKLVDSSGHGATEVLVDPSTGMVSIEYGPAMVWNTRYGMGTSAGAVMGSYGRGMMRGAGGGAMMGDAGSGPSAIASPTTTTVSLAGAHTLAQHWLDQNEPGVSVESGGDAFPGYYTLETMRAGKISGMISVNASTGAVWPHWWHGAFVAKS